MLEKLKNKLSNDIGIDLGTANTLVYVRGLGIVIDEPSVVAINVKTDRMVAVGSEAKQMMGRTPTHIKCVKPIVDGVISDYEITEEMLGYLIKKANNINKKFLAPRVVVGVPVGITNVETRAVYDAAIAAGAREVYIVEEPMAAAIGVQMPVHDAEGSMIVDLGGGTTDIAVISLSGIVKAKSIKVAGDKLIQDIVNFVKDEYKIEIGRAH
ncbi:MAG: rod shape-determining protein MreB, partial [Patescibacteria group bacterium]|nr:rod shape-determining protein MreB [Patescibacteria group bacterium]